MLSRIIKPPKHTQEDSVVNDKWDENITQVIRAQQQAYKAISQVPREPMEETPSHDIGDISRLQRDDYPNYNQVQTALRNYTNSVHAYASHMNGQRPGSDLITGTGQRFDSSRSMRNAFYKDVMLSKY